MANAIPALGHKKMTSIGAMLNRPHPFETILLKSKIEAETASPHREKSGHR
jgi:hypothetical protein